MSRNTNLHEAKKAKNDEFYTTYSDIEKELINYKDQLKGKTIYCNCDNIFISNFPKFFIDKFNEFGLKKLITTGYVKDGKGIYSDYNGTEQTIKELSGNGSFDSKECLDLLKEADVVITNPPFSIFRDYFKVLVSHDKKFLIIGSKMAYTYKDVFPYIKNGKLWTGYNYPSKFIEPNQNITNNLNGLTRWFTNLDVDKGLGGGYTYKVDGIMSEARPEGQDFNCCPYVDGKRIYMRCLIEKDAKPITACAWFTNIDVDKDVKYDLTQKYDPKKYPKYDNYDAINVDKVKDIPYDYDGVMGVPVTIVEKLGSDGLIHLSSPYKVANEEDYGYSSLEGVLRNNETKIDDKKKFDRIIIEKESTYKIDGVFNWYTETDTEKGFITGDPVDTITAKNFKGPTINGKAKYMKCLIEKDNTYKIEGELINLTDPDPSFIKGKPTDVGHHKSYLGPVIDGKEKFNRIIIQRNNPKI